MRFTLYLAVLAGVAGMTGCAPTVAIHPLYTAQTLASDLPLEGTWQAGDGEIWKITKAGDGYEVDSAAGTKYKVHLLRLHDYEFVDVGAQSDPDVGVAGHLLGKISLRNGQLYVSSIDDTWLKHMMDTGLAPPSTMGENQQIILTASTSELQKFIELHAADPDAWDDDEEGLHRLR